MKSFLEVFEEKMGTATGPEVLLFKRFQSAWSGIDVHNYRSGIDNLKVKERLNKGDISRILEFVRSTLREQQPREDYREFLELMAIFLVTVYVEAWFSVTSAAKAPYMDFTCLSKLYDYQGIDRSISRIALKKLSKHLWYLGPEAVALALFDPQLPSFTKRKMVDALNNDMESSEEHEKRMHITISNIPEIIKNCLEQSKRRENFSLNNLGIFFMVSNSDHELH